MSDVCDAAKVFVIGKRDNDFGVEVKPRVVRGHRPCCARLQWLWCRRSAQLRSLRRGSAFLPRWPIVDELVTPEVLRALVNKDDFVDRPLREAIEEVPSKSV